MHIKSAKKLGTGLAIAAIIMCLLNLSAYKYIADGSLTFLYIGTGMALLAQLCMISIYSDEILQRQALFLNKKRIIIFILILDVIFAIPTILWIVKFAELIN